MYKKRASKEETSALDAAAKALRAASMRALKHFQRRQFRTPPTSLGSHYSRQEHRFTSNNSSITRISYSERQMQKRTDGSVEDDQMHFKDTDIAAGSIDQRSGNQGRPTTRTFEKEELFAFKGSDGYHFYVLELKTQIDADKITQRSKIKGNILTVNSDDSEIVVFEQEKE